MDARGRLERNAASMRALALRWSWCLAMSLCSVACAQPPGANETVRNDPDWMYSIARPAKTPRASAAFHAVVAQPNATSRELADFTGNRLFVDQAPFITTPDISAVDVVPDPQYRYFMVAFHFAPAAAQRLKRITSADMHGRIALLVNGKLIVLLQTIVPLESTVMFSRSYSREDAIALAQSLAP